MLVKCKVTKFWEVNYKILTRILVTPVVITASNPNLGTPMCFVCSGVANLHHILLEYSGTVSLCNYIMETLEVDWPTKYWIFGSMSIYYNPVIWVSNFSIYKVHLLQRWSIKWIDLLASPLAVQDTMVQARKLQQVTGAIYGK